MIMIAIVGLVVGLLLWRLGKRLERSNLDTVERMLITGQIDHRQAAILYWCLETGAPIPPDFYGPTLRGLIFLEDEQELHVPLEWDEER